MLNLINLGLSIDKKINGVNITNIDFANPQTLLDADIVVINPEAAKTLLSSNKGELQNITLQGKVTSHRIAAALIERRREELEILSSRKRVIITLLTPFFSFTLTGQYYGQDETIYNYGFLPFTIGYFGPWVNKW